MSERPDERSQDTSNDTSRGTSEGRASAETRRTGPLGEDRRTAETQKEPRDEGATRRIPAQDAEKDTRGWRRTRRDSGDSEEDEGRTRVIKTPAGSERSRARGYHEAVEEREEMLRELYGGVDWVASFLGFVLAAVAGATLSAIAALVLTPLDFSLPSSTQELGTDRVAGLVVVAVAIFLTYLFGGYVAGRLARFDGGRNGVIVLLWSLVVGSLVLVAATYLPVEAAAFSNFIQNEVVPTYETLLDSGVVGVVISAVALIVAVLGGLAGGSLGSRYHWEIDHTT